MTFTKDINNVDKEVKEYAVSARGDNRISENDDDSFNSSVLSSIDDSIQNKRDFKVINGGMNRVSQPEQPSALSRQSKNQLSMTKLTRMLTSDFKRKNNETPDNLNGSQQTLIGFNNPSIRDAVETYSNLIKGTGQKSASKLAKKHHLDLEKLQQANDTSSVTRNTALGNKARLQQASALSNLAAVESKEKTEKEKKLDIYKDIAEGKYFTTDRPRNASEFIQKNQKIMINPGIPYVSTSQTEVFERRNLLNLKESLSKQNPFIAAPESEEVFDRYEGEEEETYIAPVHDPYQMKTIYKVKDVQEVELDSDDEDALILQQQPFETIQQTGFSSYLNHLDTKLIARRSDIIVSSTISITLTPQDDSANHFSRACLGQGPTDHKDGKKQGFVPFSLANAQYEDIWEYTMLRQRFRSFPISSNILPKGKAADADNISEETFVENNMFSEESLEPDYFNENQVVPDDDQMLNKIQHREKLPQTLLSDQLDPRAVLRLTEKDQRLYKFQKAKYESTLKTNSKKDVKLEKVVFSLKDARLLLAGNYHQEEDDEENGQPIADEKLDGEGV